MKTETKLKVVRFWGRLFPIPALKMEARIVSDAHDATLKAAKTKQDREVIEFQLQDDACEYADAIASIQSRKLAAQAEDLFVYLTDLKWEQGNYAERYLDRASLSRLFHAVKEQKDKNRDYRLRMAGALTGIIGALIGLLAILRK
jgi:hypothetical protein